MDCYSHSLRVGAMPASHSMIMDHDYCQLSSEEVDTYIELSAVLATYVSYPSVWLMGLKGSINHTTHDDTSRKNVLTFCLGS